MKTRTERHHHAKSLMAEDQSRPIARSFVALAAVLLFTSAQAQDGAGLFASKGCVACHGADALVHLAAISDEDDFQSKLLDFINLSFY